MKRVYIETNIFIYVALKHPEYYMPYYKLLRKIVSEQIHAYGSELVLFELFGAMAKINPAAAYEATISYLNFPITHLELNRETFELERDLSEDSKTTYDSIHAAVMMRNNINIIVTEDLRDWHRIAKTWVKVKKNHKIEIDDLIIIQPSKQETKS